MFDFEEQQFSRVRDFYNGKTIFLTGAAGFIGSILLQTLLRCCPEIETIYILLRSKKNVKPEDRKQVIFNKKIFDKLKENNPELLDKVHVIPGDNSLPKLGLNEKDEKRLIDEVHVVIHCAAIVNFSRPLKFILAHNVLGVHSVIELCKKMEKFVCLVYTSTLYGNCNYVSLPVKEEIYRLPFRAEKFIEALNNDDDKRLQELYAYCLPEWPNTYTFSKCLAENVILDTASDLPVAIIRPSIVVSTLKHPIPGYVDGMFGITALILGVGKGFIKVIHADPNNKLNMVPADIVANVHIIAGWSLGTKRCISPLMVHCCAPENKTISLTELNEVMLVIGVKYPVPQAFDELTTVSYVPYKYVYYILAAWRHYLPALALDGILKILGKEPKLYSLYRFYDTVMHHLNFFMFHSFEIETGNMECLDRLIHPEEREDLSLDLSQVVFKEAAYMVTKGCPFYDWKTDKRSPSERQKVKYRRHLLILSIQGTVFVILCLLIYWVFSLIFK